MQYRDLGQSGISASVVGFGAWAIGGWMWGGNEEKDSIKALHAAIDAGVNLIDTAPIYGFGLSETIIGKAIADRRDQVVLATKCGLVAHPCGGGKHKFNSDAQGPNPNGHIPIYEYLGPDSIEREAEGSLKRLGTDVIDLYQTHWQDETTPIEDTMATLLKLKDQGKIRAIGVSNAKSSHMDQYREHGPLDSDQELFSMLNRKIEDDQLPYCREHSIAMLAYSPLAQGLLTGKMTPDREFAEGDQRKHNKRFSVENRQRVQEMLDRFQPIADAHDLSMAQLTIAWTFHVPGVTHALVGARDAKQAQENAKAGGVKLSEDELRHMNETIDEFLAAGVK